ncbi:hypothetical protein [Pararhodospirillum oryzae]|uniref:Lysozyme inhibitor n=1 Tax=Pararhodospirillum oryzae TaxID=478448 RepID=A0A512H3D4_9PROT|nr:hypothetical protein [Pararhodospirillum oryzae]GEO79951.1 hypothetical protein ROR02_00820 [Pararhodospirillum oryzae]
MRVWQAALVAAGIAVGLAGSAGPGQAQGTPKLFQMVCKDGLTFHLALRADENGNLAQTATLVMKDQQPQLLVRDTQEQDMTFKNANYRFVAVSARKVYQLHEVRNGRVMAVHDCK